jgi:hypothetical protein
MYRQPVCDTTRQREKPSAQNNITGSPVEQHAEYDEEKSNTIAYNTFINCHITS